MHQGTLPFVTQAIALDEGLHAALTTLASGSVEERGAVYTRREVVEFILDLSGYTPNKPLHRTRILEPCFGNGDFLLPIVERLVVAYREHSESNSKDFEQLLNSVRAVELHHNTFSSTAAQLAAFLGEAGFSAHERSELIDSWLIEGDFLLEVIEGGFEFVVGNPPYVRQELIPAALIAEYRQRYATIFDRADIYIPFIERSLLLLEPNGIFGFICADRWMKNRYGGPLRKMIAEGYRLKYYVDMVDTTAFHDDVAAYPAITVLAREANGSTRIAHRPPVDREAMHRLANAMVGGEPTNGVKEIADVVNADSPWILESFDQLALVRRLERDFPTLEEAGCKVGIGVATGADKVFIAPYEELDVEPDRKLPLAMTRDIAGGTVQWRGYSVINPFHDDGSLVSLTDFPKLARYLEAHGATVKARHVSKKNPNGWYRTIDRIDPSLAKKEKLLIPDIKGEAHIVYEGGQLYPHHNLYYITSDEWDLKALRALLVSGIARLFISIYSTKMRGGYLRFQAQYLRRIRVPRWREVPPALRERLLAATERGDIAACNSAVFDVYGLTESERAALSEGGA